MRTHPLAAAARAALPALLLVAALAAPAAALQLSAGSGSGLIAQAGVHLRAVLPGARAAIITDENVAGLHLQPIF